MHVGGVVAGVVQPQVDQLRLPSLAEQASPAWLGGGASGGAAKALAETAKFLKDQGRIQELAKDYGAAVTPEFVTKAMK